jgi:hypothetical protein
MSNRSAPADDYLDDVDDGCGCVGVWAATSEYRASQSPDAPDTECDDDEATE